MFDFTDPRSLWSSYSKSFMWIQRFVQPDQRRNYNRWEAIEEAIIQIHQIICQSS